MISVRNAMNVAKYIIDFSNRRDTSVSNLQLQKNIILCSNEFLWAFK